MKVTVTEAKKRWTELLIKVEGGETFTIERHGTPVAGQPRFKTMRGNIGNVAIATAAL